jgi:2,3-bisphosphoglycerate-dependent phosphoglycerate mutase
MSLYMPMVHMPTRVFLLRHAESADATVFHGAESDIELSERGRRQAAAVAAVLAELPLEIVVSSAMRRARATAEAIAAAARVPHELEPRLHERRVGILSRKPFDTGGIWADTLARWSRGEADYAHEGAESWHELRARLLPAWHDVVARHLGRTLAVVAHGIVCKVILLELFPEYSWQTIGSIRNAAVTELEYDGAAWRLLRLDDLPPGVARARA